MPQPQVATPPPGLQHQPVDVQELKAEIEVCVQNLDDAYALLAAEVEHIKEVQSQLEHSLEEHVATLEEAAENQRGVAQRQAAVLHQFQDRLRVLEAKNEEWELWETMRQTWEAESQPSSSGSGSGTIGTSVSATDATATGDSTANNETDDLHSQ